MLLNKIMTNMVKLQDVYCSALNYFIKKNNEDERRDIQLFKEEIIENIFLDCDDKNLIEDYYVKSKQILNRLNNFIKIYRWKKSVLYDINADLYLESLENFPDKQKITILENNTRYRFRLSDLTNYWVTCLTQSQGLFSKPISLKNPHTNMDISTHNL